VPPTLSAVGTSVVTVELAARAVAFEAELHITVAVSDVGAM